MQLLCQSTHQSKFDKPLYFASLKRAFAPLPEQRNCLEPRLATRTHRKRAYQNTHQNNAD
uniref:Uncharacterized protein n=1 Tax=Curvibacter symbiont subsp. Hydra magnipapillata TaxID=667019 RepID=C9Y9Y7_CURXX|nr:hypothetical protein Csp_A09380 [Curvibacter putative symbiont of Hydra magnipapillata]